jgi:hypothetical protein
MRYLKSYKELFEDYELANGPSILAGGQGDGVGTGSFHSGPNSGKLGDEFDSTNDVTAIPDKVEFKYNKPIIPKKFKDKRKQINKKIEDLLKPKIN